MKVLVVVLMMVPLALGSSLLNYMHSIYKGQPVQMKQQPDPCCTPEQYEGIVGGTVGLAEDGGRIISEAMFYSYDGTNNRTNMNGTSFTDDGQPSPFRVLSLYEDKREYVVDAQGNCKYYELGEFVPSCIPASATYFGRFRQGFGQESVDTDNWSVFAEGYQVYVTVTPTNCVILGQTAYGDYEPNVGVLSAYGLMNTTLGIRDEEVFTPPSDCEPGQAQDRRIKAPFKF